MRKLLTTCLLGLSLFVSGAISGQAPSDPHETVWTVVFLKVQPGTFDQALAVLDSGWMAKRKRAQQQGSIVSYRRLAEAPPNGGDWDIALTTEYRNKAAYDGREQVFGPDNLQFTTKDFPPTGFLQTKHVFEVVETRVLRDFSDDGTPRLRLLGRP